MTLGEREAPLVMSKERVQMDLCLFRHDQMDEYVYTQQQALEYSQLDRAAEFLPKTKKGAHTIAMPFIEPNTGLLFMDKQYGMDIPFPSHLLASIIRAYEEYP